MRVDARTTGPNVHAAASANVSRDERDGDAVAIQGGGHTSLFFCQPLLLLTPEQSFPLLISFPISSLVLSSHVSHASQPLYQAPDGPVNYAQLSASTTLDDALIVSWFACCYFITVSHVSLRKVSPAFCPHGSSGQTAISQQQREL